MEKIKRDSIIIMILFCFSLVLLDFVLDYTLFSIFASYDIFDFFERDMVSYETISRFLFLSVSIVTGIFLIFKYDSKLYKIYNGLKESKEYFFGMLDSIPVHILVVGLDDIVQYTNKSFSDTFCSLDKIHSFNHFLSEFCISEDKIKFLKLINAVITKKEILNITVNLYDKNKENKIFICTVIFNDNKLIISFQDITETAISEIQLKNSEERYKMIVEHIDNGICVYTSNDGDKFYYTEFNSASEKIEKISRSTVIGREVREVFPKTVEFGLIDALKNVWKTGRQQNIPTKFYQDERISVWKDTYLFKLGQKEVCVIYRDLTNIKRNELELENNEKKLRFILDNIPELIVQIDLEGRIKWMNETAKYLQSPIFEDEDVYCYRRFNNNLPCVDCPAMKCMITGKLEKTRTYRSRIYKGKETFWEEYGVPLKDSNKDIMGSLLIARNVTDRKSFDDKNSRLVSIIENAQDSIIGLDLSGKIISWNTGAEILYGYKSKEMIGKTLEELEKGNGEISKLLDKIKKNGKSIKKEITRIRKDGKIIPIYLTISPVKNSESKLIGFSEIGKDLTENRKNQKEIMKFKTMSDIAPYGNVIIDKDHQFVYVNKAFEKLIAFNKEEILGKKTMYDFIDKDCYEQLKKMIHELISTGEVSLQEFSLVRKTNEIIPVLIGATYIDKQFFAVSVIDISERKLLQNRLVLSQKMEAIGTLSTGIAHDFNNMLHAIHGYLELIVDGQNCDYDGMVYINEINNVVHKSSELVKGLLAFGRKMDTDVKPTNINYIIHKTIEILNRILPKMITIEDYLDPDIELIEADSVQIEQALVNLGTNARDAMPDGGRLIFETSITHIDERFNEEQATNLELGKYVMIKITDTGIGIPNNVLEHIFEPFFTTKEIGKGTGLGLSVVYGIIKNHRGHIICSSELDYGTTFTIFLPIPKENINILNDKIININEDQLKGNEQILLIDDDYAVLDITKKSLEKFGYTVLTANNGENGLLIYKNMNNKIDMIIMDLGMPGIGGWKTTKIIKEYDPNAKILIASGYRFENNLETIQELGAIGFISKPFGMIELLKIIRDNLDKK